MEEVQSQRRAGGTEGTDRAAQPLGAWRRARCQARRRDTRSQKGSACGAQTDHNGEGNLPPATVGRAPPRIETGKKAAHTSTPMGPLGAHLEAKPPERAPGTEPDARPEHAPALSNFSQWRATQRAPEAGSGNTARRPVRGGGHRGGLGTPLEGTYFQAEPGNAICVQSLDDSLNSAIHITYHISLRSSSLREPRYPSTGVVVWIVVSARTHETPQRAEPRARTRCGVGWSAPTRRRRRQARRALPIDARVPLPIKM